MTSLTVTASKAQKGILGTLIFMLAMVLALQGASLPANAQTDSKGKDIWLIFNQNEDVNPTGSRRLFITSDSETTASVSVPFVPFSTEVPIMPGQVATVELPLEVEVSTSDAVEDKGIHVTSDSEITVYGLNFQQFTTDAFLGIPTDALGSVYIILSHPDLFSSQFGIVATQNDTAVTITPSAAVGMRMAGQQFEIMLDRGQTYQLQTNELSEPLSNPLDLSGTRVESDKPIAVFAGNRCANVPVGFGFCDHLTEQIPPISTWGKTFVTVPLASRLGGDTFRFLASSDNTVIFVNGSEIATLDAGEVHQTILTQASTVQSSNPILLMQYSNGTQFDGVFADPFATLIVPSEQYLANYTIATPSSGFPSNFVNITVPTSSVGSVLLDNVPISSGLFAQIGSSSFSGAQVSIGIGSHQLSGPMPFGMIVYGFADFDSYGYPGGFSLAEVARVAGILLSPASVTAIVNTEECLTAFVSDQNEQPLSGVRIDFSVDGVHQVSGFAFADDVGAAEFCYLGMNEGEDTVSATVGSFSDQSQVSWLGKPIDENVIVFDIKVGSDPNVFNCKSHGVLPVTIFGSTGFDVSQIEYPSLRLALQSDPGDNVGPPKNVGFEDVGRPSDAGVPGSPSPDGIPDLAVKFDSRSIAELIDCPNIRRNGSSAELVIRGTLKDATEFESSNGQNLLIKNK